MILRHPIIAACIALFLAAGLAQAQSRSETAHRPKDGVAGFIEGCLTSKPSRDRANAAFAKYDMPTFISNRPTAKFPAGQFGGYPSSNARSPFEASCRVRIRGLWLNYANATLTSNVTTQKFKMIESLAGTKRIKGASVRNGSASGVYSRSGARFIIQVAEIKQRGGRTTELSILKFKAK